MSENDAQRLKADKERLDWLNQFLTYDHMIYVFGQRIGLASDEGPRDIRGAVDLARKEGWK